MVLNLAVPIKISRHSSWNTAILRYPITGLVTNSSESEITVLYYVLHLDTIFSINNIIPQQPRCCGSVLLLLPRQMPGLLGIRC